MEGTSRSAVIGPIALALATADLGARLLAPREPAPEPVEIDLHSYFSAEEIARGARYARPQLALGLARSALQLTLLGGLVARERRRGGPRRRRDRSPRSAAAATAAAGAGLVLASTAASLPFSAIGRRRSLAVGLATQSWRGWAADLGKSVALESTLAAGAAAVVGELARRSPRGWWLPAAGGSVAFGTLLGALAPVLLDPLFNDFTPLPEGPQRAQVLELARAAGVRVGEVYSVDASRRTTAANAYVTGLGPTKRVVLFDTLLDRYSSEEVAAVVAHELAHVRHRDVTRSVIYAGLVAAPVSLATQRLSGVLAPEPTAPSGLPALALAAALLTAPTGLLANRLSRAVERRADAFALELAGEPEAFISFERAIALQNVADLDPPRWVTRVLSTHPSTAERIGVAVALATPERRRPRTPAGS